MYWIKEVHVEYKHTLANLEAIVVAHEFRDGEVAIGGITVVAVRRDDRLVAIQPIIWRVQSQKPLAALHARFASFARALKVLKDSGVLSRDEAIAIARQHGLPPKVPSTLEAEGSHLQA